MAGRLRSLAVVVAAVVFLTVSAGSAFAQRKRTSTAPPPKKPIRTSRSVTPQNIVGKYSYWGKNPAKGCGQGETEIPCPSDKCTCPCCRTGTE